ncbi:TetR family transcriptional regulator [Alicyclobacillus kakegawensis]|uniref:TetR family transcriptional regulator n=1 Tax=Alicyclobacillus kakegawensis TaxID=392012 RepID=UPI0008375053|nr:TetR family transcriptional regulator [Alicyclobacillus kakegawensis]
MALNKDQIVEEALRLLNEVGLEGVTLRALAKRLGVQAPTLYWHFKNKAALINAMAEGILQSEFKGLRPRGSDETWQEWLIDVLNRLRKAMLSYTDGGRVVAGAHLCSTLLDVSEVAIRTLYTSGVSLRESRLIVLTAIHFTFGQVIEEQTPLVTDMTEDFDMEQFKKDHPTLVAGIEEYFSAGHTADDLFNDGLRLIVHSGV